MNHDQQQLAMIAIGLLTGFTVAIIFLLFYMAKVINKVSERVEELEAKK